MTLRGHTAGITNILLAEGGIDVVTGAYLTSRVTKSKQSHSQSPSGMCMVSMPRLPSSPQGTVD